MTVHDCVAPTTRRRVDDAPARQSDEVPAVSGVPAGLSPVLGLAGLSRGSASRLPATGGPAQPGAVLGALRRQAARNPEPSGAGADLVIRRVYIGEDRPPILALPQVANSEDRVNELGAFNWSRDETVALAQAAPAPTYDQLRTIMGRFTAAQTRDVFTICANSADVVALAALAWSAADVARYALVVPKPTVAQLTTVAGFFTAVQAAAVSPRCASPAELASLAGLGWPAADILTLATAAWSAADVIRLATAGWAAADAVRLAGSGWTGPHAVGLIPLARPRAELLTLATTPVNGQLPTPRTLAAVERFSTAQLIQVITSATNNGSFQSWDQVLHLAEINDTPANLTTLGTNANLTTHPWLEDQLHQLNQAGHDGAKSTVGGVVDTRLTCWQWATRGFEAAPITVDLVPRYFSFRTNFPDVFGVALDHAHARDQAVSAGMVADYQAAERAYLDANQAALQTIIDNWVNGHGGGNARNQAAQRAIMELQLTDAGFTVLPPNTPARWYICMHEKQTNVSWEHWWIKSRRGDVIETFPQNAHGGGLNLAFHDAEDNMGDLAEDFRHEVPVRDLLPSQKAVIKRELQAAGRPFTDDLP
ncbi:MAG: hypothetical protein JO144_11355 [Actinobacteria bacterium]|nr:hypothetical protein [Actinomycetota bacterium]